MGLKSGGRNPFTYTIVKPSASNEGRIEKNGYFNRLKPGQYSIQFQDSCGAILTQKIEIDAYLWQMSEIVTKAKECGVIEVFIPLSDNRGNTNADTSHFKEFSFLRFGCYRCKITLYSCQMQDDGKAQSDN